MKIHCLVCTPSWEREQSPSFKVHRSMSSWYCYMNGKQSSRVMAFITNLVSPSISPTMNELNKKHVKKLLQITLQLNRANWYWTDTLSRQHFENFCILVYEYLQFTLKRKKKKKDEVNILQHLLHEDRVSKIFLFRNICD